MDQSAGCCFISLLACLDQGSLTNLISCRWPCRMVQLGQVVLFANRNLVGALYCRLLHQGRNMHHNSWSPSYYIGWFHWIQYLDGMSTTVSVHIPLTTPCGEKVRRYSGRPTWYCQYRYKHGQCRLMLVTASLFPKNQSEIILKSRDGPNAKYGCEWTVTISHS